MRDANGYPEPIRSGRSIDPDGDSSVTWWVYDRSDPDVAECLTEPPPDCACSGCWEGAGCLTACSVDAILANLTPARAFYQGGRWGSHGPMLRHLGPRRVLVTYRVVRDV